MLKLPLTKILQSLPYVFISQKTFRSRGSALIIPDSLLYYVTLHLKFASFASLTQLVEIFGYDSPSSSQSSEGSFNMTTSTLVYQFHTLSVEERVTLFVTSQGSRSTFSPKTIGDLFVTSVWLEREVNEMHGLAFDKKQDLRNLMLQYGDSSAPFRKAYPSIGTRELGFDSVTDTLVQNPISTQL